MRTPITTHVTLPNLRSFEFQAVCAYEEAVLSRMTTSRLEDFLIHYYEREQLMFSLVQFMGRIENLRFNRARFHFDSDGRTRVYVHWFVNLPETDMPTSDLAIIVNRRHLDWQISSVAQIFNALRQIFSAVEHLTLTYRVLDRSSEGHDEVERTEWRKLLRSFSNVKTLRVDSGLVIAISRCLRLDDGEHPLNVLPELEELIYYSWSGNADDAFTSFVYARQMAGCPVTLIKKIGNGGHGSCLCP
jgi:hypothetical protein